MIFGPTAGDTSVSQTQQLFNQGVQLFQQRRFEEAAAVFQQALKREPRNVQIKMQLANACRDAGQLARALGYYRDLLRVAPQDLSVQNNLGVTLTRLGQYAEAVRVLERAVRMNASVPELYLNLGVAQHELDLFGAAEQSYRQALRLRPVNPLAQKNLATLLRDQGRVADSITEFRTLVANYPDYPDAHFGLAFSLLLSGDFSAGWQAYEWRWHSSNSPQSLPQFDKPRWEGQDITGKTLLLYGEQGAGDAIQFVRYVPMLAAKGVRVVVQCQDSLVRLFASVDGVVQVVPTGDEVVFDYHYPLMSLPGLMGSDLHSLPSKTPYLKAADASVLCQMDQNAFPVDRFKVGVVWEGSGMHINNRRRSCSRDLLLSLATLPSVLLYNLQKLTNTPQAPLPQGVEWRDYTELLDDFSDTAALIERLDLVVTVDTAVAHLAGALGRPVWVLLPYAPDWRWLLDRDDSPWYPSMRLFRQASPGDWAGVIAQVKAALLRHTSD